MEVNLQRLKDASAELLYLSDSDSPFEVVSFDAFDSLENTLLALSEKEKQTQVKVESLQHFFRNMITVQPSASPEQQHIAQRFQHLQQVLTEELHEVAVYLLGEVEVDAFILGKTGEGSYSGLRTKVIQT